MAELPNFLGQTCSRSVIRRALQREGYLRGIRRTKPLVSEVNGIKRLAWTWEHVLGEEEQWGPILHGHPSPHRRQWCTRFKTPLELFIPYLV